MARPVRPASVFGVDVNTGQGKQSVGQLVAAAAADLAAAGVEEPAREARYLLSEVLAVSGGWVLAHPEAVVSMEHQRAYESAVDRRAHREPAAYITGHREFFGLDLEVSPSVLIPRPETELLVELALEVARELAAAKGRQLVAVDVGTGSGAVAIALAFTEPTLRVVAVDTSADALAIAHRNAECHGVADRIEFRQGDLLEHVQDPLDLLVANLPYVPSRELDRLMPEVSRYEPRAALDGGPDGTALIRRALEESRGTIERPGALLFEIGEGQGSILSNIARSLYPEASVQVIRDYAGLERILSVRVM